MIKHNLTVNTIFCQAKNLEKYNYTINNNKEKHTLKKNDLLKFIIQKLPSVYLEVQDLLKSNLPFLVDFVNKKVIKLKFDLNKEMNNLKKETKKEKYLLQNNIHNEEKKDFTDKYINIDSILEKYQKL